MTKYYRVLRTSETGRKFAEIERKASEADAAIRRLKNKYGFEKHYSSDMYAYGDISAVIFPSGTNIDTEAWKVEKNIGNEAYSPRMGNKKGKAIKTDFDAVPKAYRCEVDEIVGINQVFQNVGYTMNDSTYFGFTVGAKWKANIPADCEEITASEYDRLCRETE